MSSVSSISSNVPPWLTQKSFTATTPLSDKIYRVANIIIFAVAIYSFTGFTAVAGIAAYGFYAARLLALRKIVHTILGHVSYPATIIKWGDRVDQEGNFQIHRVQYGLREYRDESGNYLLEERNYKVNRLSLYKSGTKYDAIIITHESIMNNGKWNMRAFGNAMCMEQTIIDAADMDRELGFSTLLINGPGVGHSWGSPTRYQMGAAFEAGLQFLEQDAEATHISMQGLSLGAGMIGEAILQHDFTKGLEKGTHYLSISDRTFSRLSTVGGALIGSFVKYIGYAAGIDLDGVAAAKKLSDLDIRQIVIQHYNPDGVETTREEGGTGIWHDDEVIPDNASLSEELSKDQTLKNKLYLQHVGIGHNDSLPETIQEALDQEKRAFATLA